MNIRLITLGALLLLAGACRNEETALSQSEISAKVDSLVGTKMEEMNRQSMEDLDRRMSIEVKVKADSIVQSTLSQANPPDNTASGPQNQP